MSATSTRTAERTVNTRSHPVGSCPLRVRGRAPPERRTVWRAAPERGAAGRRAPVAPAVVCLVPEGLALDALLPAALLVDVAGLRGDFAGGVRSPPRPGRGAEREDAASRAQLDREDDLPPRQRMARREGATYVPSLDEDPS